MPQERHTQVLRFGVFDVNLSARELRKHATRVRLPGQPFCILAMLLEKPGEVITREEMQQKLWASDTFVDFEHGLNSAIKKLRAALGDSPENSRYIETIPRVGYRFIAPVDQVSKTQLPLAETPANSGPRAAPAAEGKPSGAYRWVWFTVVATTLVVMAAAAGAYFHPLRTPKLTERDTVVLADFDNKTGDAVFDDTLRQGLSAQLAQSPFLNLLSDEHIAQTLSLMTQSKDARLANQLAREICQRTASTATIEGSIRTLGREYVLGLKAVNCHNGDSLAEVQVSADGKEQVLKALGDAATRLRARLGESLTSVQKYDAPLEDVTTSSLEALNAYSLGLKARHEKGDFASIPFFRQAVQLDPKFAMAYLRLGTEYENIGETHQGHQDLQRAFALRDRVSKREGLYVAAIYYDWAIGDLQKAEENYQLWTQTYPRDPAPFDRLGNNYLFTGQYPLALEALLEEKKLASDSYFNYTNLVYVYLGLNRLHDARSTIEQALARKLEPVPGYEALYRIDFLEGNVAGMREDGAWAAGKAGVEHEFLDFQADTEAYSGHRREAWTFSQKASETARNENDLEVAARYMTYAALREAEFGNSVRAYESANLALKMANVNDIRTLAALALARAGFPRRASAVISELAGANPSDTVLNFYWLPTIRASAELDLNRPGRAVEALQATVPYELGQPPQMRYGSLYPVYVRGQAYMRLGQVVQAAYEFQKILDHPGCVLNFCLGALARLQLGRAQALAGDKTKARAAYQDFLTLWKDADPDIPILRQAKEEYAKLSQ